MIDLIQRKNTTGIGNKQLFSVKKNYLYLKKYLSKQFILIRRRTIPTYKLVVCIYTCEKHRKLLLQFHKSVLGQYIQKLPDTKILEVYANPNIHESTLKNNELILKTEEKYEALSLKTHKMFEYCTNHLDFQHILKIDVTTIMTHFDVPEYKDRKPIDQNELILFLISSLHKKDYDGFTLHSRATIDNAENWASKKGATINYKKLFGEGPLPPFYSGKCYILSNHFAKFVSQHGKVVAKEHERYFLGSEDVMIGRLYEKFITYYVNDDN